MRRRDSRTARWSRFGCDVLRQHRAADVHGEHETQRARSRSGSRSDPQRGPASATTIASAHEAEHHRRPRRRAPAPSASERGRPAARQPDAPAAAEPGGEAERQRRGPARGTGAAARRRSWDPHHQRAADEQLERQRGQPEQRAAAGWPPRTGCSASPGSASSRAGRSGGRCGSAPRCRARGSSGRRSCRRSRGAAARRSGPAAARSGTRRARGRSGSAPRRWCRRRWCRPGSRTRRPWPRRSAGSISPLLFSPSVRSSTTFDLSGARRSRLTAVARPLPIAVPSSRLPILRSITACSTTG